MDLDRNCFPYYNNSNNNDIVYCEPPAEIVFDDQVMKVKAWFIFLCYRHRLSCLWRTLYERSAGKILLITGLQWSVNCKEVPGCSRPWNVSNSTVCAEHKYVSYRCMFRDLVSYDVGIGLYSLHGDPFERGHNREKWPRLIGTRCAWHST